MSIIQQYHKDTDTTYVYKSERYRIPGTHKSKTKRKLIGKIDPESGEVVPCGKCGPKKQERALKVDLVDREEYKKLWNEAEQVKAELIQANLCMAEMEMELDKLRRQHKQM